MFYNELHKWDRKRYLSGPFMVMKGLMIKANNRNQKARSYAKTRYLKLSFEGWKDVTLTQFTRHTKVAAHAKKSLPIIILKSWHRWQEHNRLLLRNEENFLPKLLLNVLQHGSFKLKLTKR